MNNHIKKILVDNLLTNQPTTKEGTIKMSQGALLDTALYISEYILPRIEINKGTNNPDYKQMFLAVNACLLCVEMMHENDRIKEQLFATKQLLKWTQEQLRQSEGELSKYTTVKELIERETLDMTIDIVNGKKIQAVAEAIKLFQSRIK